MENLTNHVNWSNDDWRKLNDDIRKNENGLSALNLRERLCVIAFEQVLNARLNDHGPGNSDPIMIATEASDLADRMFIQITSTPCPTPWPMPEGDKS